MKTILALLSLSLAAAAQEDVRKRKPGWADLGVRVEDAGGKIVVREVFESDLKVGDEIVALDGVRLRSAEHLMTILWEMDLGKSVKLKLADREIETKLRTIEGQKNPGENNKVHNPPAIRASAIEPTDAVGKGKLKTVYAFDLTMSFEWDLTEQEMKDATAMIDEAARILFDASEGQMYVRRVEIYTKKAAWDRAHYWVRKARGGSSGIEHVTPGGQCMLNFSRLDRTAAIILAHEAGHMQFGSGDEYPYGPKDPQKDCRCLMGRDCFRGVFDLCAGEGHTYREKGSCWDNLKRWYPDLVKVDKPQSGPELVRLPEVVFAADDLESRINLIMAPWRENVMRGVREALKK